LLHFLISEFVGTSPAGGAEITLAHALVYTLQADPASDVYIFLQHALHGYVL
jgi:hypothetical protein